MKIFANKKLEKGNNTKNAFQYKIFFIITGTASLLWLLIRVIPKPNRATYPCMKATMPIASSFVIYVIALLSSVVFLKNGRKLFQSKKVLTVAFLGLTFALFGIFTLINKPDFAKAGIIEAQPFNDPLGANAPVGDAKGIYPGRVVWIFDPNATNENCTNNGQSDAYYQDFNTDQEVVDQMVTKGLLELTGQADLSNAWDALFKYFNKTHGKGEVGYNTDETIFIKINAVTAWSGAAPDGDMPGSIPVEFDTSPQTILSMLRQLVNEAGVPEEKIYIGDPMADIWNLLYHKFSAEFPNINYVSKRDIPNRRILTPGDSAAIMYSDKGAVLKQISGHSLFTQMTDADYLLNFPTMKGHRWAGVTFFAKNHFGSNTSDGSWQLHQGLMNPDNAGMRYGYKKYRVLVDLMGSKYLGGKTLLYFMDALWSTSYEHQKPQKFQSAPFNNHWSSSVLFSCDPVAIESVCLDILQKEFKKEDLTTNPPRYTYVQWDGVDDYLHQAASSEWWPEGISYDPDNSGTPIPSLGVHEHWNNENDMEYSRNLKTGEGIELHKFFFEKEEVLGTTNSKIQHNFVIYPNPCINTAKIKIELSQISDITIEIISTSGQLQRSFYAGKFNNGMQELNLDMENAKSGTYFCRVLISDQTGEYSITKKLIVK